MAIAAMVPVIWGLATGHMEHASWITLAAECICWVELKGSFAQRTRVLAGGTIIAIISGLLGSLTGFSIWLSVALMLGVGFITGLFKNLGDRGSGLAVCVFVIFIICNANPVMSLAELETRLLLLLIGGAWNLVVGVAASALMPVQEPYRRTIALVWKAIANLTGVIAQDWDGKSIRSSIRNLYEKEREIRTALDNSFHFYETLSGQKTDDKQEYELAQLRKLTALVAANILSIAEELENISIRKADPALRVKIHTLFRALQQASDRMAIYIMTLSPEEELLLNSRIARINKLVTLIKQYPGQKAETINQLTRIVNLTERTLKLLETGIQRLQKTNDTLPVYRSYSIVKTLFILHPRYWLRNVQLLFNFNTFNTRYALRSAIAAALAMFIYKWFNIDHGYWIAFTVIIVVQPYFGATFQKAIDRVIGTVTGGIAGGLLVLIPSALYVREIMLFLCFVFMIYFLRKKYSVAAFFITVSVVILFDVEDAANPMLIITRALATVGGAAMAIVAGFALLPTWDKKYLPQHIANAIACNYEYFKAAFYLPMKDTNWTRYKRKAESKNSEAFDSFNRYIQEPGRKKYYSAFFQLITHNIRITRELNNIHLEQDNRSQPEEQVTPQQRERIEECLLWFNRNIDLLQQQGFARSANMLQLGSHQPAFALSMYQMLYTEKLLVELKSMNQDLEKLINKPDIVASSS